MVYPIMDYPELFYPKNISLFGFKLKYCKLWQFVLSKNKFVVVKLLTFMTSCCQTINLHDKSSDAVCLSDNCHPNYGFILTKSKLSKRRLFFKWTFFFDCLLQLL